MKFYLLPYQTYLDNYQDVVQKTVVTSLDNTMCVIETDSPIENYTQMFDTPNEVRNFWHDETTEEWRNWIDEDDY